LKLTKKQALEIFRKELRAYDDIKNERIYIGLAWEEFTARLRRDGFITGRQYTYWASP
jgi:hypothetical protein